MTLYDRNAGVLIHYNGGWTAASAPEVPTAGTVADAELRNAFSELIQALRSIGIFTNPA